jgi:exopolyphosphatase/guanosine-5'-triphosphate,3'-diphosphate pyrophosphatase
MNLKAVIDLGSLKLKVSIFNKDTKEKIFADNHLTLLGKGLEESGHIKRESLTMLNKALAQVAKLLKDRGVNEVSIIGTEALRKADNIDKVHAILSRHFPDRTLEVIDQHREAELFFDAISRSFPDKDIAAIDIGGGSVQIILGNYDSTSNKSTIHKKHNLKTGTYRYQQKYSPDNSVISPNLATAEREIRREFQDITEKIDTLVFGSTCMLDFIQSSKIPTNETGDPLHPVAVSREALEGLLSELVLLAPDKRDHYYPDGGYFMYGADYLLVNLLAAIDQLEPSTVYPTNLNSSYAFIENN